MPLFYLAAGAAAAGAGAGFAGPATVLSSSFFTASSERSMPGLPATMPASAALRSRCRSCSLTSWSNREQLLLKLVLQLLRHLVDFRLGVLLEALAFDVHPLDIFLERRARR